VSGVWDTTIGAMVGGIRWNTEVYTVKIMKKRLARWGISPGQPGCDGYLKGVRYHNRDKIHGDGDG
jgi:hypothetical protein